MKTDTDLRVRDHIEAILRTLGEDPGRDGLLKTPQRVERSLDFLTRGYRTSAEEALNGAVFDTEYDEMVVVKDIDFFSLCEHHMLPFFGRCHIAYLPDKKIVGLSKLPRLVEVFARRLQVQERLTLQIAREIETRIKPKGVGVIMDGLHLCMMMRGVEKQNAHAVTSSMRGRFRSDPKTREEFLQLVRFNRPI